MESPSGGRELTDPMFLYPDLVGRLFAGRVAGVADFGLLVGLEVDGAILDGLLRFDQTPYPEVAHRYKVGDPIYVAVTAVDLWRRKISLALPAEPTADEWR